MPYPIQLAIYPLSAIFLAACTSRSFDPGLDPAATMDPAATIGPELPAPAVLRLNFSQIKQFDFSWTTAAGAEHYQLLERRAGGEDYAQLGDDLVGESVSLTMPLHLRWGASFLVRACNSRGCTDSEPVAVVDSLASAVGYIKASNTGEGDQFGFSVALSADGNTLAVGAPWDALYGAGAVHVFVRANSIWSQQAYIKASNPDHSDHFGASVALSADGHTLAVGADEEDSNATGIDGDQADNSGDAAGAVYVFVRAHDTWSQQAYVKASNPDKWDHFGDSVALSADGNTLAVGAPWERSAATGIDGDQADNFAVTAGAIYVFVRADQTWSQQAYVKASNTGEMDHFGDSVALSADGDTLAVGASYADGAATGIGGDQADDSAEDAGAVYVFVRANNTWSQRAYVKAANTGEGDQFGSSIALSADGNALAIGASWERSAATGINGDQADNSAEAAGAVYLY